MAEQITNYKCPQCTGPLKFSSSTSKLECEYCDSSFSPEEIETMYAQKDLEASKSFKDENEKKLTEEQPEQEDQIQWDESNAAHNAEEASMEMRTYNCPSCGAELVCEKTTAATSCPYCGNPSIIPGQMTGVLKPDYIIPFRMDREKAKDALKKYYNHKRFLPTAFSTNNQIEKIQGIYVPFWFFDGTIDATVTYKALNKSSSRSGDYIITTTEHYHVVRFATLDFENIPTDASKKMPDDLMDSIEPFNYSELTEFSTAYLPGFLADKYDVSMEESKKRSCSRAKNTILSLVRSTVQGYDSVSERSNQMNIKNLKAHYAFLPVWLIHTKWNNQNFLFAMNGQTGKFVGNLPICPKKLRTLFFGLIIGISSLFYFLHISEAIVRIIMLILTGG